MTRLKLLISIILAFAAIPASAALSAEQILDKTAKTLTASPSATVKFSLSSSNGNTSGAITMSGNKFTFNAGDINVWYDGHSQWALQRSAEEVSLTQPTAAELIESNPLTIISNHKKLYNAKLLASSGNAYKIQLTPRGRHSQVRSAIITINKTTFAPKTLQIVLSNKSSINVTINSISKGAALPASYFKFDAKSHPGVELIDLR